MATSLSSPLSDTGGCVIFQRLPIAAVSGQPRENGELPIKSSGVCVLGCCALRGPDPLTPTVSIRHKHFPYRIMEGFPVICWRLEASADNDDQFATGKFKGDKATSRHC
jgi:hypothetical protein